MDGRSPAGAAALRRAGRRRCRATARAAARGGPRGEMHARPCRFRAGRHDGTGGSPHERSRMRRDDPMRHPAGHAVRHAAPPAADARTSVIITGFGPFPGVPVNATMRLVPELVQAARQALPGVRVTSAILATEWATAPMRLDALITEADPDLIVHFGVSS